MRTCADPFHSAAVIGGDVLRQAVQSVLDDAKQAGGPYIFIRYFIVLTMQ